MAVDVPFILPSREATAALPCIRISVEEEVHVVGHPIVGVVRPAAVVTFRTAHPPVSFAIARVILVRPNTVGDAPLARAWLPVHPQIRRLSIPRF